MVALAGDADKRDVRTEREHMQRALQETANQNGEGVLFSKSAASETNNQEHLL